jgi:biotin transport system ATP-binding protein
MPVIEFDQVTFHYEETRRGIVDVCLSIEAGEFVLIVGPNGSGKTTLLRHMNGLLLPDAGIVKVEGRSVSEDMMGARQAVGMVFQDSDSQIVGDTVAEDVMFGPQNLGFDQSEIHRRVLDALATVGMTDFSEHRTSALSGGEKRRLAIAAVLAMAPKVLVFDEPFSDLDYFGVRQILRQIVDLHAAGYTILLTTHDLEKVIGHADRLIIMKDGRIVRDGPAAGLLKEVEKFGVREPCASRFGAGAASWLI